MPFPFREAAEPYVNVDVLTNCFRSPLIAFMFRELLRGPKT